MRQEEIDITTKLLIFQATSFCNIYCKYCYLPNRNIKDRLTSTVAKQTIVRMMEAKLLGERLNILFHDGEPTVLPITEYEDIIKAISDTTDANISYDMQTNGTLINQNWCEFFLKNNFHIGLSIDGPQHIHDRNRVRRNGKGTFEEVYKGMNHLIKYNIPFSVIAVIDEYSINFPDEIFNFFFTNGVKSLSLNFEETLGVNKSSLTKHGEIDRLLKNFLERMFQLQLKNNGLMLIREFRSAFDALMNNTNDPYPTSMKRGINGQYQPYNILSVWANGSFSTFSPELSTQKCEEYGDFVFGNVFNNSFEEAIQTEKFKTISTAIYNGLQKCKSCKYYNFCGGGLPGNKFYEHKTFDVAETTLCKSLFQVPFDIVVSELERTVI